jgi:hypothetical protein
MMAAKNDITGDSIKTKPSKSDAYAKGWDRIFGSKKTKDRTPSGELAEPVRRRAANKVRA